MSRFMGIYRFCISLFIGSSLALQALPEGAHPIAGDILPLITADSPETLRVESGRRAIVEWENFSIDSTEQIIFSQAGPDAAILNRVIGNDLSQLLGRISSNGAVFLVNPHGILIGPEALIETGGFLASTLPLSNADFLLNQALCLQGQSEAKIENQGTISCPYGDIYLIAKEIENTGSLETGGGRVGLLSGVEVLLRPKESPHVYIRAALESDESLQDLNVDVNPYARAIRHSGRIRACVREGEGGEVFLISDENRSEVSGQIAARKGEVGGLVEVLGAEIHLLDEAKIDVSAPLGGGTILVGGDKQGANPEIFNASRTWVGPNTLLNAEATLCGNAGKVIVWSNDATWHYGTVYARGGAQGGDGGFVEVSGAFLDFRGNVNCSSPLGNRGTLLLDPTNITIDTTVDSGGTLPACPSTDYVPSGTSNVLTVSTLQTHLATCNAVINTSSAAGDNGDITVNNAITWSSSSSLSLIADRNISIGATANITNTAAGGGSITLTAGNTNTAGTLTVPANVTTTGGSAGISMSAPGLITLGRAAATVTISTAGTGGISILSNVGETGTAGGIATVGGIGSTLTISVTGSSGNITITGVVGGSSGTNYGVDFGNPNTLNITNSGTGNINISGTTSTVSASVTNTRGVVIVPSSGGTIQTASGNISITGLCRATGTVSNGYGIQWQSVSLVSTSSGSINLTGTAALTATAGSNNVGVDWQSTTTISTAGTTTITGVGGFGSGSHGFATAGGGLSCIGGGTFLFSNCTCGANATSASAVFINAAINGNASSSGNLTISGASAGAGNSNVGVTLSGATGTIGTASYTGNISITATSSGTSSASHGIVLTTGAIARTTGSGTITLNGTGSGSGSTNNGILVTGVNSAVQAVSGLVSVTGTAGAGASSYAIQTSSSGVIRTTGAGGVTLSGSPVNFSTSITTGSGPITYSSAVAFDANATFDTTTTGSGSSISFNNAVTNNSGNRTITVNGGTAGTITFSNGMGTSGSRMVLSVTNGGSLSLGSTFYFNNAFSTNISTTLNAACTIDTGANILTIGSTGPISWGAATLLTLTTTRQIVINGAISNTLNPGSPANFSAMNFIATSTTGTGVGITLAAAVSSYYGNITMTGTGGNGTSSQRGIAFATNGQINSLGTGAQAANISLTGTGGASTTFAASGIAFASSTNTKITANSGNITCVGTGVGAAGSFANIGLDFVNGTLSTTSGTISLQGQGGVGDATGCAQLFNASAGVTVGNVTSTSGSIIFTHCIGGSGGGCNYGVELYSGTVSAPTITATDTIRGGTGTGTDYGFYVTGATLGSTSTTSLNVTASTTGTGSGEVGIFLAGNGQIKIGSGSMSLNGTGSSTGTSGCHGIQLTSGTVSSTTGTIALTGTAASGVSTSASHGILLATSNAITSSSGTITLTGASTVSGASHGVSLTSSWTTGTSGTVFFTNCSGGTGAGSHGVNIAAAFSTTGGITGTGIVGGSGAGSIGFRGAAAFGSSSAGNVSMTASSNGNGTGSHGISLSSGALSTTGAGTITLSGTTSLSNTGTCHGININGGTVSSTGSGTISLTGTVSGGGGVTGTSVGILMATTNGITSSTGAIQLSGTSNAPGANSYGLSTTATWNAATTNTLTLTGTGGSGNTSHGIRIGSALTNSGAISFNGTAGSGTGSFGTALAENVTTSGGAITFTGSTILETSVTLDATNSGGSATGGNITFSGATSTINATSAGAQNLTLQAGTGGAVSFGGVIGGITRLGSLTITNAKLSANAVVISKNISSTGFVISTASPVTLDGSGTTTIDTSAGDISFPSTISGTVSGSQNLVLTTTGAISFAGDIGSGAIPLGSLTLTAGASGLTFATTINTVVANTVTVGGTIATSLSSTGTALTIDASGGSGGISFGGTINGARALVLAAGAGPVTLSGIVGGGTPLTSLTVTTTNTLGGGFNIGASISAGSLTATGVTKTTLTADSVITTTGSGGINFSSTIDGDGVSARNLTLSASTGPVTLSGSVGGTIPLNSLTVTTTNILDGGFHVGANISVNTLTVTGVTKTTMIGNSVITTTGAGGINFSSTIDGAHALTLAAGTAPVTLSGIVGGATPLTSLTVTTTNTLGGGFNIGADISVGSLTATGVTKTTLTAGSVITTTGSGGINFSSTIDGDGVSVRNLTLSAGTGPVTLTGIVGGTHPLGIFTISTSNILGGGLNLGTSISAASLDASNTLKTTLTNAATVITTGIGGIDFGGTIDGTQAFTLNTNGAGNILFGGAVGTHFPLGALLIVNTADWTTDSISAASITQSAGSGTTEFGGALETSTSIALTGTQFIFNASVVTTTDVSGSLTITNGGQLTINQDAPIILAGPFLQNGAGAVSLGNNIITSDQPITFFSALTLIGDSLIVSGSSGAIQFISTIDGMDLYTLSVLAGGSPVLFNAPVGQGSLLDALFVGGSTITITGDQSVFQGSMTYTGNIALAASTVLTTFMGNISVTGSITGHYDLDLVAPHGTILVSDSIDLSGGTGAAGNSLSADGDLGVTLNGAVFCNGGSDLTGIGGPGGDISLNSLEGSISVYNLLTSGGAGLTQGGDAGSITIHPSNGITSGLPDGIILLNPDISNGSNNLIAMGGSSVAPAGAGTDGAITLSASRASPVTVATIVSSLAGNDVTILGGSLTMGQTDVMTVLGNITLSLSSFADLGNLIALEALTIDTPTIHPLIYGAPYEILSHFGTLYTTPTLHFFGGTAYSESGATFIPPGPIRTASLGYSPAAFLTLLTYNDTILNFDTTLPPPPTPPSNTPVLRIVYAMGVAQAEFFDRIPAFYIFPYRSPQICYELREPADTKRCFPPKQWAIPTPLFLYTNTKRNK